MALELLLICFVMLLVFPPQKWPMLIEHVTQAIKQFKKFKSAFYGFFDSQLAQIKLAENEEKARASDAVYDNSAQEPRE